DVDGIPPGLRGFTRFAAQTWVVEIEGGPLGADRRDRDEVVARGWARGGPLQRVAEAPGIVGGDPSAAPCGEPDVEQERQVRQAEQERAHAGDLVQGGEAVDR